eukprot:jgi/Mesen1/1172/ME000124S00207
MAPRHSIMGSSVEFIWLLAVVSCFKFLLVPAYRSTDFEVHRHWLAITHSLPISKWYVDETSEWTLDYPPLFAWLERGLSMLGAVVDPRMVDLQGGLNYASPVTILFQRATVVALDSVLFFGTYRFCRGMAEGKRRLAMAAVLLCPGLLMVDHVHFQYNGFLLGLLLLSLSLLQEGADWAGGVVFAALVCTKHLFAVAGPFYLVYLLRHHCWGGPWGLRPLRLLLLGSSVLSMVLLAFGPFALLGQMGQVMARLFPFGRGLCHAYWAPNVWSLYNVADKALALLFRATGAPVPPASAAFTGGLVGDASPYSVLPHVTPAATMLLVLLSMMPCLAATWRNPRPQEVARGVAHVFMCGFMLGWHVHEKAALHFVVPLALLCADSRQLARQFVFLSTVANYSLFPLLFEPKEYPIKVLLLLLYTIGLWTALSQHFGQDLEGHQPPSKLREIEKRSRKLALAAHEGNAPAPVGSSEGEAELRDSECRQRAPSLMTGWKLLYLCGLVVNEVYGQFLHRLIWRGRLPFLPLLLTSVYCAAGISYAWFSQLTHFLYRSK